MTHSAFVKAIIFNVFVSLSMMSSLANAKLPWKWQEIKPGLTPAEVQKIIPKGKLVKGVETGNGEQTGIFLTGFNYAGTAYRADFFFRSQRLTRIRMEPDMSTNLMAIFPPLAEASRQINEFRADALKSGGRKVSSTIDLDRKNKFGEESFQLPEWKLDISCMPHSYPDVADIFANFSANK